MMPYLDIKEETNFGSSIMKGWKNMNTGIAHLFLLLMEVRQYTADQRCFTNFELINTTVIIIIPISASG
jgi:hypothetical protein